MTPNDPALLSDMLTREQLGRRVTVSQQDGRNVFRPVWAHTLVLFRTASILLSSEFHEQQDARGAPEDMIMKRISSSRSSCAHRSEPLLDIARFPCPSLQL